MLTELGEAIQTLRTCVNGIPARLEWAEVPLKIGKARALMGHIDQLVADRNADRAKLAVLTAAVELHRPEARDGGWWCARRVRSGGCGTWKAAQR